MHHVFEKSYVVLSYSARRRHTYLMLAMNRHRLRQNMVIYGVHTWPLVVCAIVQTTLFFLHNSKTRCRAHSVTPNVVFLIPAESKQEIVRPRSARIQINVRALVFGQCRPTLKLSCFASTRAKLEFQKYIYFLFFSVTRTGHLIHSINYGISPAVPQSVSHALMTITTAVDSLLLHQEWLMSDEKIISSESKVHLLAPSIVHLFAFLLRASTHCIMPRIRTRASIIIAGVRLQECSREAGVGAIDGWKGQSWRRCPSSWIFRGSCWWRSGIASFPRRWERGKKCFAEPVH